MIVRKLERKKRPVGLKIELPVRKKKQKLRDFEKVSGTIRNVELDN